MWSLAYQNRSACFNRRVTNTDPHQTTNVAWTSGWHHQSMCRVPRIPSFIRWIGHSTNPIDHERLYYSIIRQYRTRCWLYTQNHPTRRWPRLRIHSLQRYIYDGTCILRARLTKSTTLAGRGRSAAIAICYLLRVYQLNPSEAQETLLRCRPQVCFACKWVMDNWLMDDNGRLIRIYFKRMKCECITRISLLSPNQEEYHVYLVPFNPCPFFLLYSLQVIIYSPMDCSIIIGCLWWWICMHDFQDQHLCFFRSILEQVIVWSLGALIVKLNWFCTMVK